MEITNLDLHLNYPAGKVVKVDQLKDVNGGINPAYYRRVEDGLLVSSSAAALIRDSGEFQRNPDFQPPEWFSEEFEPDAEFFDEPIKWVADQFRESPPSWYASWQTADKRVFKLRPHETVTGQESRIEFDPTPSISSKEELAEKAAKAMTTFINRVEAEYPDAHHIVFTGGKDSQLIHLVPKNNDDKWHAFSGEPNYSIVKEWLEDNPLSVNNVFRGNSENNESLEMLNRKIIASDLYADPRHIRWRGAIERIIKNYESVIFWAGTEGDTYFSYHPDYQDQTEAAFWRLQRSRAPSWQGTTNQVTFNLTNSPQLSPYHSPEMWEVFFNYDPNIINKGDDVRDTIGKLLAEGEEISWPDRNPGPKPLSYELGIQGRSTYFKYLYHDF